MTKKQTIEERLSAKGLTLPPPLPSAGAYAPYMITPLNDKTSLVFISGQIAIKDGKIMRGQIGRDMDEEQGRKAALYASLALLAQLKSACDGDLTRARKCLRLGGFINSSADFGNHPEILNGASELLLAIMDDGRHSRFAIGVSSLPRGCAVEIEAVFEITN